MKKTCINPTCKKEIPEDSRFCGFCAEKQITTEEQRTNLDPYEKTHPTELEASPSGEALALIVYSDDYEIVRQFDPVITPTKEQVSFDNLLNTYQEAVSAKNYPFSVDSKEQRWRAEGGKGKQRIVIQPTHDSKWDRILFLISVEQMGNDTTIKLSVLRKNEMAEFYYSTLEAIGAFCSENLMPSRASIVDGQIGINNKNDMLLRVLAKDERLDLSKSGDIERFKSLIINMARAIDACKLQPDAPSAALISEYTGISIDNVVKQQDSGQTIIGISFELFDFGSSVKAEQTAHILLSGFKYLDRKSSEIPIDYKVNWNDDKKYLLPVEQSIRVFAEIVESLLREVHFEKLINSDSLSNKLKTFLQNLDRQHQVHDYCQHYIDQIEIKKTIIAEISDIEKTSQAKIVMKIQDVNEAIKIKAESLKSISNAKVPVIIISIILSVSLAFQVGPISFLVASAIFFGWFVVKLSKANTIENLKYWTLPPLKEEETKIRNQISEKRDQISAIERALVNKKDELTNTIMSMKQNVFKYAKQNEITWRTPSFVDEELEQLISLIKNLFNETNGKLTRKQTGKALRLESAMGLGGMGFDE